MGKGAYGLIGLIGIGMLINNSGCGLMSTFSKGDNYIIKSKYNPSKNRYERRVINLNDSEEALKHYHNIEFETIKTCDDVLMILNKNPYERCTITLRLIRTYEKKLKKFGLSEVDEDIIRCLKEHEMCFGSRGEQLLK